MAKTRTHHIPGLPMMVTPFSDLGTPTEKMKWWAPFGWLLVTVFTLIFFAFFLVMTPVVLLAMAIQNWVVKPQFKYRRNPAKLKVAIIGGGWGGLQCLERFKKLGVNQVDVFERYDDMGGTWHKNLRYKGLQIHGSMTVTSFDNFPYSQDNNVQGGKVMAEEVERYIHNFAEANNLRPHCQFHSNVDAVHYDSQTGKGTLSITDTATGKERESGPYDMVIWASMAAYGNIPKLPDAALFKGQQLHTTQYKPEVFDEIVRSGKKVLVVGGGKAACDVALSFHRAGYNNFTWMMRKPYLFYKFEVLLHNASFKNKVRGLSYLSTVLWCGVSKRLGAFLHWSSGHLHTYGKPHTDFKHFHGGVLCPTQRKDLKDVDYTIGEPVRFTANGVVLKDGTALDCDVVIWATGNKSGIDTLHLTKDGAPFVLDAKKKLYNHFIVPEVPVMASSTALWTTFGPMRGTNAADLTVHHLCVRKGRSTKQMRRAARRQMSTNSINNSFIWAHNMCWLQQWVYFHIDLMLAGITPIESFLKHAIEVFVLSKETPLDFKILPKKPYKAQKKNKHRAAAQAIPEPELEESAALA